MNINKIILIVFILLVGGLIATSFYNNKKTVYDYGTNSAISNSTTSATNNTDVKATTSQPQTTHNVVTSGRVMGPVEASLKIGETGSAMSASIKLNDVVNDYRCPVDVQCIEAGAIVANVTIKVGDKSVTQNFPSDEVPFEFEGFAFSITDVAPDAKSGTEILKTDYKVTFKIAPTAKGDNI